MECGDAALNKKNVRIMIGFVSFSVVMLALAGCSSNRNEPVIAKANSFSPTVVSTPVGDSAHTPAVSAIKPATSPAAITEQKVTRQDEKAVHDLITAYFSTVEQKDYASAWEMLSSNAKKGYTKEDAIKNHFGIQSLKLVSIQSYLLPQEPKEDESKPTIQFQVKLDIVPGSGASSGAWGNGINLRFVGVVKEQGGWKIDALATGP